MVSSFTYVFNYKFRECIEIVGNPAQAAVLTFALRSLWLVFGVHFVLKLSILFRTSCGCPAVPRPPDFNNQRLTRTVR